MLIHMFGICLLQFNFCVLKNWPLDVQGYRPICDLLSHLIQAYNIK
jgi:hypothetical protein